VSKGEEAENKASFTIKHQSVDIAEPRGLTNRISLVPEEGRRRKTSFKRREEVENNNRETTRANRESLLSGRFEAFASF
jgi:hypothetical protein